MMTIKRAMLALSIVGVVGATAAAGAAMTSVPSSVREQARQSPSAVTQGIRELQELGVRDIAVLDASSGQVVSRLRTPDFTYLGP